MTFMNKILTYLRFCPSKESAQSFRVRNIRITLKQKEYRDAIIGGIGGGVGSFILWYIVRREFAWTTLIIFPIGYFYTHLWFNKRLAAMKEEDVQRRE